MQAYTFIHFLPLWDKIKSEVTQNTINKGPKKRKIMELGMVVHVYNPSTWEAPGLHSETLSQKKKEKLCFNYGLNYVP
jgi:hypothetical protein